MTAKMRVFYVLMAIISTSLFCNNLSDAAVSGVCANCHTMHNSQNKAAMATYGADGMPWKGTGPYPALTRGNCAGCHGMGTANKIVNIGGSAIPQVYHTDASGDLAGGNFAYISGAKGSGASDSKGHNVRDMLNRDSRHIYAPGHIDNYHRSALDSNQLTCAGSVGCHGLRLHATFGGGDTGVRALKGAHHKNVDGLLTTPTGWHDSYRFLDAVKGLENPDPAGRWQNKNSSSHNEYYGRSDPGAYMNNIWNYTGCANCHWGDDSVGPVRGTISGFCGTCHPNFHSMSSGGLSGIGGTVSPFLRHPSDIVIKSSGEYAGYTIYNIGAPVGRQTLSSTPIATVAPGSDTITCLSCHMAHASDYPSMLRWDYAAIVAGTSGAGQGKGCFICHTQKDG